ncbi:CxxxxCH/CxxCH domain-containing protein, partial [Nonomuraea sp. RK-328]|nr:CxxxxCH/CxxCH domain-containing protein [Nonomuraea sp. RK-328]
WRYAAKPRSSPRWTSAASSTGCRSCRRCWRSAAAG